MTLALLTLEAALAADSDEPTTRDRIHELDKQLVQAKETQRYQHNETLSRLDWIAEKQEETLEFARKTNGRVTKLEQWKWWLSGIVTGLSLLWVIIEFLLKVKPLFAQ